MKKIIKTIFTIFVIGIFVMSLIPLALADDFSPAEKNEKKGIKERFVNFKNKLFSVFGDTNLKPEIVFKNKLFSVFGDTNLKPEIVKEELVQTTVSPKHVQLQVQVIDTAKAVIESLNKLEEQIELTENIDENRKTQILEKVAAEKLALEEKLSVIENLGPDPNLAKAKVAANKLKDAWDNVKPVYQWSAGMLLNARHVKVLDDMTITVDKINERVEQLEDDGYDVSEIDELVEEFSNLVDNARELYINSHLVYIEAGESDDVFALTKKAYNLQAQSSQELDSAKEMLRQIFEKINELEE